jgi:hypothetical protein
MKMNSHDKLIINFKDPLEYYDSYIPTTTKATHIRGRKFMEL